MGSFNFEVAGPIMMSTSKMFHSIVPLLVLYACYVCGVIGALSQNHGTERIDEFGLKEVSSIQPTRQMLRQSTVGTPASSCNITAETNLTRYTYPTVSETCRCEGSGSGQIFAAGDSVITCMTACTNGNVGNTCVRRSSQVFDELANCCLVDCGGFTTSVSISRVDGPFQGNFPACFSKSDTSPDGENPIDVPIQPFNENQPPEFNARVLAINFEVILEQEAMADVDVTEEFITILDLDEGTPSRFVSTNNRLRTRAASSAVLQNKRVAMDIKPCRRSNCAVRVTIRSASSIRAEIVRRAKKKLTESPGFAGVFQVKALLAHRVRQQKGSNYVVIFKFKNSYLPE